MWRGILLDTKDSNFLGDIESLQALEIRQIGGFLRFFRVINQIVRDKKSAVGNLGFLFHEKCLVIAL